MHAAGATPGARCPGRSSLLIGALFVIGAALLLCRRIIMSAACLTVS
jgi:hypothetical protein